jgi:hypothetical protein
MRRVHRARITVDTCRDINRQHDQCGASRPFRHDQLNKGCDTSSRSLSLTGPKKRIYHDSRSGKGTCKILFRNNSSPTRGDRDFATATKNDSVRKGSHLSTPCRGIPSRVRYNGAYGDAIVRQPTSYYQSIASVVARPAHDDDVMAGTVIRYDELLHRINHHSPSPFHQLEGTHP